jgi:hypothetical protein
VPEQSRNGEEQPSEALPTRTPQTVPAENELRDNSWSSASDAGWQAAQVLYEDKSEEMTSAGLPKRVPNAYLVPGSISPAEAKREDSSFADTTAGLPGTGAVARSASAVRSRMASFQQGYTSGRHALKERPAEVLGESGVPVSGPASGSSADDSSKE